jgi:flagellin
MNTYRQLGLGNAAGAKSMEKLSSGYRINRAGDDAAGLSISEKMRGQIRGLTQASRNAQDGISLIQTAEGALNETQAILQRMRELAVQASTDTNEASDRGEIQKEINQLTSEINRIGNTTEFNTKTLLNGALSESYVVADAVTTPAQTVSVTKAIDQTIQIGDEPISWSDADSATEFNIGITGTADNGFQWAAIDTDETNEIVIARDGDNFTVTVSGQDGTGKTISIDADLVAFDAETSIYSYDNQGISFSFKSEDVANWADGHSVTLNLNTVAGAGNDATGTHTSIAEKVALVVGGTSGDATYTMTSITVDNTAGLVLENADRLDIAWDETSGTFTASIYAGTEKLSETVFSLAVGETLNYNADGISFDFTVDSGDTDAAKDGTITGSFALKTETNDVETAPQVVTPAVTEDRSLSFQVGANAGQAMTLSIEDMRAAALEIASATGGAGFNAEDAVTNGTSTEYALNVTTKEDASKAITKIQDAIDKVSSERSKLGAVQNRLEHTIKNLDTSAENLQASESRIRDVDMAKEMMEFTKNNILQQAATAMLAQANQAPQGVLQLLR